MYREVVITPTNQPARVIFNDRANAIVDKPKRSIDRGLRNRILFGKDQKEQNEQGSVAANKDHQGALLWIIYDRYYNHRSKRQMT
jgi:hypothetical protein